MLLGIIGIALATIGIAVAVSHLRDRVASKNGNSYDHLHQCRRD